MALWNLSLVEITVGTGRAAGFRVVAQFDSQEDCASGPTGVYARYGDDVAVVDLKQRGGSKLGRAAVGIWPSLDRAREQSIDDAPLALAWSEDDDVDCAAWKVLLVDTPFGLMLKRKAV